MRFVISRLTYLGLLTLILLASVLLPITQIPRTSYAQGNFAPGYTLHSLEFDGQTRTYWLFVPGSYDGSTPLPLVVGLHGGTGTAQQFQRSSGMNVHAEALGSIAVYPNGTGALQTWNAGHCCGSSLRQTIDDVGFIRAVVTELQANLAIDPARIYATGMSNGGMMAYRLAAEASDLFAAVAPVSGSIGGTFRPGWDPYTNTPTGGPVSILAIHGMKDPSVKYEGGVSDGIFGNDRVDLSAAESISTWVAHNQCAPEPVTETTHEGMVITDTYTCPEGIEVVLVSIVDGEHAWPGSTRAASARSAQYFDASELILHFFLDHGR